MKVCKNVTEFYQINDKDISNILIVKFKNILKYNSIEDLKSEIYLRLHRKKYIEKYRPFEIQVNDSTKQWFIKPSYAKFSTYIYKFVFNYILAYHKDTKKDDLCLSLDDYRDICYCEEDRKRLESKDIYDPREHIDLKIEIDQILKILEKKTKDKGSIIDKNEDTKKLTKTLDKNKKGCSQEEMQTYNVDLEDLEERGIIKTVENNFGDKTYFIDDPERRSLFNLFKYYMGTYKDKEISQKFNMTVAGVGALKRALRKEIRDIEKNIME